MQIVAKKQMLIQINSYMYNMNFREKMNTAYTTLASIIGLLILFLYLSWLYVSLKFVWTKNNENVNLKQTTRRWKNLVDSKNKNLGWFDLGNHIIIIGVVLFAIFIVKNT